MHRSKKKIGLKLQKRRSGLLIIILWQLFIMDIKNQKIALLVDGDNAQAKMMDLILEEASKYGKVTIRRVYGDWTTQLMNHWKSLLNEMAFNPIQKFSYTRGKIPQTVH